MAKARSERAFLFAATGRHCLQLLSRALDQPNFPIRLAAQNHGLAGVGLLLQQKTLILLGELAGALNDDGHGGVPLYRGSAGGRCQFLFVLLGRDSLNS